MSEHPTRRCQKCRQAFDLDTIRSRLNDKLDAITIKCPHCGESTRLLIFRDVKHFECGNCGPGAWKAGASL